jgi:hypothetical protein
VTHRVFDTQREQRRIFAQSEGGENKQCSKRKNNPTTKNFLWRLYHVAEVVQTKELYNNYGRKQRQQIREEGFLQQGQNNQVFAVIYFFSQWDIFPVREPL